MKNIARNKKYMIGIIGTAGSPRDYLVLGITYGADTATLYLTISP